MNMNLVKPTQELYRAFGEMNTHFFGGELQEPVIAILSTVKKNAYGWFTFDKIWQTEDGEVAMHEIAIGAEFLNREYTLVMQTLLHEMVHLYCKQTGIKDTRKKGKYHNDKFKEQAEAHGFHFTREEPEAKLGWYDPELTEEALEAIESMEVDEEAFQIARTVAEKKKKVKPVYRYMCPECEVKVRSRKELNLHCNDCDTDFIDMDAPPADPEEGEE